MGSIKIQKPTHLLIRSKISTRTLNKNFMYFLYVAPTVIFREDGSESKRWWNTNRTLYAIRLGLGQNICIQFPTHYKVRLRNHIRFQLKIARVPTPENKSWGFPFRFGSNYCFGDSFKTPVDYGSVSEFESELLQILSCGLRSNFNIFNNLVMQFFSPFY